MHTRVYFCSQLMYIVVTNYCTEIAVHYDAMSVVFSP